MKHHYILTTALVAMLSVTTVSAQDYTLFVDFDKKVIKVDSLGLPQSFKVMGILRMLPELLERPGSTLVNDYEIQVEDMSVDDNADVVLSQLQLADIDNIEISEDPMSSYQHNGQGGSINIKLKNKNKGTWGSASVDGTTEKDLSPQFLINHNSGKFLVRGMLLGEIWDTSKTNIVNDENQTTNEDFKTQLARVYMQYRPKSNDTYKLNLSESYSNDKETFSNSPQNHKTKKTTLKALFNYKHDYNPHSGLEFEVQYNYLPVKEDVTDAPEEGLYANKDFTTNSLGGKLEYKKNLLPYDNARYADLIIGVNGKYTANDKDYISNANLKDETISTIGKTTHIMPYLNFESKFGQFKFKLAAEYQYFNYKVKRGQSTECSVDRKDITGKLMLSWQFKPNRHLRFIADRKLDRADNEQVYPMMIYDPQVGRNVQGNPDLLPTFSHEFALDYISNHNWNGHKLTLNAGVSYNLIDDIIRMKSVNNGEYSTYHNYGDNKLLNVNLMALYAHKIFTLSLAANMFRNDIHDQMNNGDPETDHSYYYNIALSPAVNLSSGWMGYLNLTYYSKVDNSQANLGDCLEGQIKIGKSWGQWNVHCFGRAALTGKAKGENIQEELIKNCVGVGVRYQF